MNWQFQFGPSPRQLRRAWRWWHRDLTYTGSQLFASLCFGLLCLILVVSLAWLLVLGVTYS